MIVLSLQVDTLVRLHCGSSSNESATFLLTWALHTPGILMHQHRVQSQHMAQIALMGSLASCNLNIWLKV